MQSCSFFKFDATRRCHLGVDVCMGLGAVMRPVRHLKQYSSKCVFQRRDAQSSALLDVRATGRANRTTTQYWSRSPNHGVQHNPGTRDERVRSPEYAYSEDYGTADGGRRKTNREFAFRT